MTPQQKQKLAAYETLLERAISQTEEIRLLREEVKELNERLRFDAHGPPPWLSLDTEEE